MPFSRIRWRLAAWNLAVLGLVLAATIGSALASEARAHDLAVERELRLEAERQATRFSRDDDEKGNGAESLRIGASGLFAFWVDRRGVSVPNSREVSLAGLPDRAALSAALGGQEVLANQEAGGVPVRVLSVPVYHEGRVVGAVQVGKALSAEQRELVQLTLVLLLTGAAGLVLSAGGSVFLAGRAMRPIREAFERQRQFIADASHELRTPVAVLRARAEVLQREGTALPPAQLEQVQQLRRDAEELSALLEDLLDLARLDAGQVALTLEPVALAEVAEEIAAQLGALAKERAVGLHVAAQPVWGRGNLSRLRQVLRALVDNALKHTPAGGRIVLEVARQGHWARLRITDTGEGIAPEHLPRVHDRFYRVDTARGRGPQGADGGAGLGLAIAAELVRLMRGHLRLESTLGRGTTATLLLPLAGERGGFEI